MAKNNILAVFVIVCSVIAASCDGFDQVVEIYSSSVASGEDCGPKLAIETPYCKVEEKKNGYELRKYPEGQIWVETLVANTSYSMAISVGFYRLFYYISGKNKKGETIEMTAPVLIHPHEKSDGYRIAFFAPSRYKSKEDLPEPLDENVKFCERREETHAVMGPFGGFPMESEYEKKVKCLKEKLEKDDIHYDDDKVYFAGYSSPFEFVNRKQEVHLVVTSSK